MLYNSQANSEIKVWLTDLEKKIHIRIHHITKKSNTKVEVILILEINQRSYR